MDSAIKSAQTNASELQEEKENVLKKIEETLEGITEHDPTSLHPFMTRPKSESEQISNGALIIILIIIAIALITVIVS